MTLDADEAKLLDEISFQMPEKKIPLKPKPARPSPFAKRAPGPAMPRPAVEDGLDMFMNPDKAAQGQRGVGSFSVVASVICLAATAAVSIFPGLIIGRL